MASYLNDKSAVPWWAAFGAPLVGVPLLVGLLALGTSGDVKRDDGKESEASFTTEQTEALQASIDLPPVTFEARLLDSRS